MATLLAEKKLLDHKKWWEAVAAHTIEQATVDSQSNYTFRKAQEKLATIDRALRRVRAGSFGYCEDCGVPIESERLELLMDSDCHVCARCAVAARTRRYS